MACLLLFFTNVLAQTSQFSNYYNTFLNLNPAQTSSSDIDMRVSSTARWQWPNLRKGTFQFTEGYKSQYFSAEYAIDRWGIGLMVLDEKSGVKESYFNEQTLGISVSRQIPLENFNLYGGFQFNFQSHRLIGNYWLIDDFLEDLNIPYTTGQLNSWSLSTGIHIKHSNFHAGASLYQFLHYDQTDETSFVLSDNTENSFRFNYKIYAQVFTALRNKRWILGGNLNLRRIEKKIQMESGIMLNYRLLPLNVRRINTKSLDPQIMGRIQFRSRAKFYEPKILTSRDAIITSLGFRNKYKLNNFSYEFHYSHDFTVSGLGSPANANEVSLVLLFDLNKSDEINEGTLPSRSRRTREKRRKIEDMYDCLRILKISQRMDPADHRIKKQRQKAAITGKQPNKIPKFGKDNEPNKKKPASKKRRETRKWRKITR